MYHVGCQSSAIETWQQHSSLKFVFFSLIVLIGVYTVRRFINGSHVFIHWCLNPGLGEFITCMNSEENFVFNYDQNCSVNNWYHPSTQIRVKLSQFPIKFIPVWQVSEIVVNNVDLSRLREWTNLPCCTYCIRTVSVFLSSVAVVLVAYFLCFGYSDFVQITLIPFLETLINSNAKWRCFLKETKFQLLF